MSKELWFKKTFNLTKKGLTTRLGERSLKKSLSLEAKIHGVENFYRGYIKALDKKSGMRGRKVSFEWEKTDRTEYTISVFSNPTLVPRDGEDGGGGIINPPPPKSPPPSM